MRVAMVGQRLFCFRAIVWGKELVRVSSHLIAAVGVHRNHVFFLVSVMGGRFSENSCKYDANAHAVCLVMPGWASALSLDVPTATTSSTQSANASASASASGERLQ